MKKIFEIEDQAVIDAMMDATEYGTLALSYKNKPYSIPVNFVHHNNSVYFHGSQSGRKMQMLKANNNVSFSIVQNYSIIASYFSSNEGLACPATQFFKSISIDGKVVIVESRDEKANALSLLMQKLQPEGKYKTFDDDAYTKMLKATAVLKIEIDTLKAKFKFGQHLSDERFNMIVSHLEDRESEIDKETIAMMKRQRDKSGI